MSEELALTAAEKLVAAGRYDEAHEALGRVEVPLVPNHLQVLRVIECQEAIDTAQNAA